MTRAESRENLAGVALKLLSLCQSMLPRLNSRLRSSRAMTLPSWCRLEMSFTSIDSRRAWPWTMSPVAISSGPKCRLKAICCASSISWPRKTSTP